jgi:hypothetical protein
MLDLFFHVLEYVGIAVQVVLLYLLLAYFRKYPVILAYSCVNLATTFLEGIIKRTVGLKSSLYGTVFYTDEVAVDLLLFLVVISLTYQAARDNPLAAPLQKFLIGVVAAALILPFVLLNPPYFRARWFNGTSQMLNFGATLMNLALWTVLLGLRRKDPQLLLVSVGVGITVTGASIAYGLRQVLTVSSFWVPNLFLILTNLAGVAIWCWAFRPGVKTVRSTDSSPKAGAGSSSETATTNA